MLNRTDIELAIQDIRSARQTLAIAIQENPAQARQYADSVEAEAGLLKLTAYHLNHYEAVKAA